MMKFFGKILLFTLLVNQLYAQTIRGVVVDAKTNEPLPSAAVYISNSTKGTQTDLNGKFVLTNIPNGAVQLVATYIGYDVSQQNLKIESGKNLEVQIRLQPNNQQLNEVSIKASKDKTWEKHLRQFKQIFLGNSPNAAKCKILNEWVLDFENTSDVFKAKASQPIEIENRALGYKLYYALREFSQTNRLLKFVGTTRFEELQPLNEKEQKLWKENRQLTYAGSEKHFFRSMIEGTLEKEGFYLYEMNSLIDYTKPFTKVFPSNASLITDANSNKYLQGGQTTNEFLFFSKLPIEISFSKPTIFGNTLTVNTRMKINRPFTVMSDGWLNDPLAFEVVGLWSNERISNMLPREYGPEIINNPSVETPSKPTYPRVYVHTNKTDYAVGERIWMSAYLTEGENHIPIQEIRPLYTQLYSPTGEMVADEILLTSTGKAVGHIQLSDSLFSGVYRLKAFTREMLNIPPIIFEKQIIIQNPIDKSKVALRVANNINSIEPPALKINLTTDKTVYQPREMVQLKIDVKSLEELPRSGTFSVSVVDLNRILFDKEAVDINTSLTSQVSDIQPITNLYIKENHLSIRGTVRNQRTGKKLSNHRLVAMLVDSTTTQTKVFESDKSGNFFIDNIDFEGSKIFTYEVLNKKNKIDPEAVALLNDFPPRLKLPMLLTDQNQLSDEQQQNIYYLSTHPDGVSTNFKNLLLQHNNQNLKPKTDSIPSGMPRIYSKPDYSITFKENSPRYMNVFEMLQGTLPGVRVFGNLISGRVKASERIKLVFMEG